METGLQKINSTKACHLLLPSFCGRISISTFTVMPVPVKYYHCRQKGARSILFNHNHSCTKKAANEIVFSVKSSILSAILIYCTS